jgi:hypothetical protein
MKGAIMPGEVSTGIWEVVEGDNENAGAYKDQKLAAKGANATNDSLDRGEDREVADAYGTLAEASEIEERSKVNSILHHGGVTPDDERSAKLEATQMVGMQKTIADERARKAETK